MSRRKKLAIGALSALAVGVSAPAWGFFAVAGTGAVGYAKADALGTPTVSANRVLGLLNINLLMHFQVDDPPEGLAPTGYTVRTPGGTVVCHMNATSCDALLNISGDDYEIFADRGPWSSLVPATCSFEGVVLLASCTGAAPAAARFTDEPPAGPSEFETAPVDETAAPAASAPTVAAADDTGTSDTDGVTKESEPRLVGTAPPLSTVILSEGSVELGRGEADAEGTYSIKTALTEGEHDVTAVATTAESSTAPSAASPITVDLTSPALTADQIGTDGDTRTVGGTAGTSPGDSGTVRMTADNGATPDSGELAIGGDGQYGTDVQVAQGETLVTLTQSDLAGNTAEETVRLTRAADEEDPAPITTHEPDPSSDPPSGQDDTPPQEEEPVISSPEPTSTAMPEESIEANRG